MISRVLPCPEATPTPSLNIPYQKRYGALRAWAPQFEPDARLVELKNSNLTPGRVRKHAVFAESPLINKNEHDPSCIKESPHARLRVVEGFTSVIDNMLMRL